MEKEVWIKICDHEDCINPLHWYEENYEKEIDKKYEYIYQEYIIKKRSLYQVIKEI